MKHHFVVAICDKELLGKEIRKDPEFKIKENFYFEKIIDEEKAIYLMQRCTVANLVGKKIIKLALEKKFITKENIMMIRGVPHAQFIK